MYYILTQKWWVPILRGIIALIIGGVALFRPIETLQVLFVLLGVFLLLDGVIQGATAWIHRRQSTRWKTFMFEGLLGFIIGLLALVWPLGIASVMVYLFAFWALVTGAIRIAAGMQLRRMIDHEWFLVLSGVLSVILGIILVLVPMVGMITVVWVFGFFMLLFGVIQLFLGKKLRQVRLDPNYDVWVDDYLSI